MFIVKSLIALMFFVGCVVLGGLAIALTTNIYNYATNGIDAIAIVIGCEESIWRGTTNIHLTYRYNVNGNQYTLKSISAFGEYRDCVSLPSNGEIEIIYLENEPSRSIIPNMSTFPVGSESLAIQFILGAIYSGYISFRFSRSLLTDYLNRRRAVSKV